MPRSLHQPAHGTSHVSRAWSALTCAICRSPLHRLLDRSVLVLTFTGRTSGRRISLPVSYARDGDDLVVFAADHDHKHWWRNFRTAWPASVRLQGRDVDVVGRVVTADRRTRDAYDARFPRAVARVAGEHQPLFVRLEVPRPVRGTGEARS